MCQELSNSYQNGTLKPRLASLLKSLGSRNSHIIMHTAKMIYKLDFNVSQQSTNEKIRRHTRTALDSPSERSV
jgi:hypothetical protein